LEHDRRRAAAWLRRSVGAARQPLTGSVIDDWYDPQRRRHRAAPRDLGGLDRDAFATAFADLDCVARGMLRLRRGKRGGGASRSRSVVPFLTPPR
jgi:hypothetical protein